MITSTLLTKKQVAARLNMTVRGVEGLMAKRSIPFHRPGSRTVRFDPRAVEDWLERTKIKEVRID